MLLHTPVMLKEVCDYLPQNTQLIVDCTLWHGGHAIALLSIAQEAKLIGFDIDENMLKKAEFRIQNSEWNIKERMEYVRGNYADIVSVLAWRKAGYILNDLWVNLEHFKDIERGFSIRGDVPLDMRFDRSQAKSAATIMNTYTTDQLAHIFEQYADFSSPKALELAQHIVSTRKQKPIETTHEFKKILNDCGLGDPASIVIFQALRIETNGEMDNLQKFLSDFPECLQLSWRCCIITYHSIEDRLVKQAFHQLAETGKYVLVNKKALKPNYKEVAVNRAARSAKMRILEKISK